MLPVEAFRKFAEGMVDKGRELLVRDKKHDSILFVFPEQGPTAIVQIGPFREERLKMHQIVRSVVQKLGGVAFILIGESWTANVELADAGRYLEDGVQVKDLPGRGESLTVFAMHPDGRFFWEVPFTREDGAVRFGRMTFMDGDKVLGGLADALGQT